MEAEVYTQHSPDCPQRKNRYSRKCRCRKWIYIAGERRRFSAKTRSWEEAERKAAALEKPHEATPEALGVTVSRAVTLYLEDKKQQSISPNWERKIKREVDSLEAWCKARPVIYLREITLSHLEEYRKTWKGAAITRKKRQERLRSFFSYCQRHGWIEKNSAAFLSTIRTGLVPTDYFNREEMERILKAAATYTPNKWRCERAVAMIHLLRYSGLRIGDAARLERSRLQKNRLFLYTQKTGTPVYVPIPEQSADLLHNLKNPANARYFFWSGSGSTNTPVYRWWETLRTIFTKAKIEKRAHPHQFRHTFAIELLLAGVPIEQVAILLGHSSIRVTERHYSGWVKARQEQLENSVRLSWTAHSR